MLKTRKREHKLNLKLGTNSLHLHLKRYICESRDVRARSKSNHNVACSIRKRSFFNGTNRRKITQPRRREVFQTSVPGIASGSSWGSSRRRSLLGIDSTSSIPGSGSRSWRCGPCPIAHLSWFLTTHFLSLYDDTSEMMSVMHLFSICSICSNWIFQAFFFTIFSKTGSFCLAFDEFISRFFKIESFVFVEYVHLRIPQFHNFQLLLTIFETFLRLFFIRDTADAIFYWPRAIVWA